MQSQETSEKTRDEKAKERENNLAVRRIYRNLIVFSVSAMLFNSSQKGIDNLQTSLNSSDNLGLYFHLVYSGVSAACCFFLPIVSMKLLGYKWTIVVFQLLSTSYILGNHFRNPYTLLTSAALHGIACVVLYAVHGSLIASLAKDYLNIRREHRGQTFVKFFAINGTIFHFSHLIGSAISAIVLNVHHVTSSSNPNNEFVSILVNDTMSTAFKTTRICGAHSCPDHNMASPIQGPPRKQMIHLTVIYLILSGSGILTLVALLDNLKPKPDEIGPIRSSLKENLNIFKNLVTWLFIPIYLFIGSFGTFIGFDLSVNYISCGYGINILGVFFLIMGVSSMISSAMITQVTRVVNKTIMISLVIVLLCAVVVYLYFWTRETNIFVLFGLAAFFGLSEATWGTFLHSIIGLTFYEKQAIAYTTFRFVLSLTSLVSYAYSMFVCTYVKIATLVGLALVSFVCIITIEIIFRCRQRRERRQNRAKVFPVLAEETHL